MYVYRLKIFEQNSDYFLYTRMQIKNVCFIADAISKAVSILKKWNPLQKPKLFMVDSCDEEIDGIEQNYPGKSFVSYK